MAISIQALMKHSHLIDFSHKKAQQNMQCSTVQFRFY